jgi:hypothetical protein
MRKLKATTQATIGCRTSRKPESANARLNLGVVQVHVPFHCRRTLFGLNVREVHRLRVLLQGHRPVDLQALIQRVKNFIGQWTDITLRAILVVVVGQLARDLLTVHTVADMPSAVGLVDVPFCMSKVYRTKGECATKCATLVSSSAIESLRRSGRVVKCGGLENR